MEPSFGGGLGRAGAGRKEGPGTKAIQEQSQILGSKKTKADHDTEGSTVAVTVREQCWQQLTLEPFMVTLSQVLPYSLAYLTVFQA